MNQTNSIIFADSQFEKLVQILKTESFSKFCVLVDSNTSIYCLPILQKQLLNAKIEIVKLEMIAGEENKQIESCIQLWTQLSELEIDRNAVLLNLGGGVVTDLGAFVAATYKRGIHFMNIPTSLLAMVDAAIGGKCGIDFDSFKNQIGLFQNADYTFVYPEFLNSLPEIEWNSGKAELIKHALIHDIDLWNELRKLEFNKHAAWLPFIERGMKIKHEIVLNDFKESGERKKLNFGHTIGHAIESYCLIKGEPIPHGFAIAAGMLIESFISLKKDLISIEQFYEVERFLWNNYPKLNFKSTEIQQLVKQDKKNFKGQFQFSLLKEIGDCVINQDVEIDLIVESLNYYQSK